MLEDLFADNLEDEPDDIERVIEGGRDEQNASGQESNNEEENNDKDKEDKDKDISLIKIKRKLAPRPVLNPQRLKGPRGLGIIEQFFSDIKLQGKGREREDLDLVLGRMEHWCHRLIPKMQFDDSLKKIEKLGSKKEIVNYVKRIRLGMEGDEVSEEVLRDDQPDSPPPADPFDQLLSTSSVPAAPHSMEMTEDQRERMLRNRLIAEERRAARIKKAQEMKARFQSQQSQNGSKEAIDVSNAETFVTGNKSSAGDFENSAVVENKTDTSSEKNYNIASELNKDQFAILEGEYENQLDKVKRNENQDFIVDGNENDGDVHLERNKNQPNCLIEINQRQPDVLKENYDQADVSETNENQLDNFVERNENRSNENHPDAILYWHENQAVEVQPDAAMVGHGNLPDVLNSNENQPDVLGERHENQPHGNQPDAVMDWHENQPVENLQPDDIMEGHGNLPDVLNSNENQPDILAERNENQFHENQPDVLNNIENQLDILVERNDNRFHRNQPDVIMEGPEIQSCVTENSGGQPDILM